MVTLATTHVNPSHFRAADRVGHSLQAEASRVLPPVVRHIHSDDISPTGTSMLEICEIYII